MSERAEIGSHFMKRPEIAVDRAGEIAAPGALIPHKSWFAVEDADLPTHGRRPAGGG